MGAEESCVCREDDAVVPLLTGEQETPTGEKESLLFFLRGGALETPIVPLGVAPRSRSLYFLPKATIRDRARSA